MSKNRMPKNSIQAIIFDMDGVISDTQIIHSTVESNLLKEYGIDIHPDEITRRYSGMTSYQMFPQVFASFGIIISDIEALVTEKKKRIDQAIRGNVRAIPGTKEFIMSAKSRNIPIAVASASRLSFIDLVLSELGIKKMFNAIASSEEVKRGKPDPDIFLLAAERLGVVPARCIVVEDGIAGMIAAKRAGMRCIGLVKDMNNKEYPADFLVKDLRDININEIQ